VTETRAPYDGRHPERSECRPMDDRALWLVVRRACLMVAAAIATRYNMPSHEGSEPRRPPAALEPNGAAAYAPAPSGTEVEHG
jgi:hypothetical protein